MSLDPSSSSVSDTESTNYKNEYVFLHDNPLHANIGDAIGDGADSSASKELKVHLAIYSLSPSSPFHLPAPTPGKLNTYTHEPSTPLLKYLVRMNDEQHQYEFPSFPFLVSAEDQDEQLNLRFREECFLHMFEFLQLNVCEYAEHANISEKQSGEIPPMSFNPVSIPDTNVVTNPDSNVVTNPESNSDTVPESNTDIVPESNIDTVPESNADTVPESNSDTVPESNADTVPESNADTVPESNSDTVPESNSDTVPESNSDTVPESNTDIVPESNADTVPESNTDTVPESNTDIVPESNADTVPESNAATNPDSNVATNPNKTGGGSDQTCDAKTEIERIFQNSNEFAEAVYRGVVASQDKSTIIVLLNYDELFLRVDMSKTRDASHKYPDELSPLSTFLKPIMPDMYPVSDDNTASRFARWALVYELVYAAKILGVPVDPMIDQIFWENKAAYQLHYFYYDKINPKSLEDIISMGVSVSADQIEQSKQGNGDILRRRDRIVDFPFCVYLVNDEFSNETAPKTREESDRRIASAHIPSRIDNYKYAEDYGDRYCFSINPISDDPAVVSTLKRYALLEYEERYLDEVAETIVGGSDEPTVTGSTVTEPTVTEPTVTEPTVTEPTVTEPTVTEPTVTEPTVTEPTVTEPTVTGSTETGSTDDVESEFTNMSVATIHFRQTIGTKEVPIWGVLSKGQFVSL